MDKELKIEHYLLQLDRELGALPVSQRAEIITEIKSHIRDSSDLDPQRDLDSILRDLGPAKAVAERYLIAKGVLNTANQHVRHGGSGGSWFKWLAIGTVAFFAFIFLSGMAAIWYLSPLIKVDEARGRVTLFGGMIDVNKELGQVKVGNITVKDAFDDKNTMQSEGVSELAGHHVKLVRIPFNTAKIEVQTGKSARLTWKCESAHNSAEPKVEITAGVATLNLDSLNLARCLISLPLGMLTEIRGVNGHMDIEKPTASLDIQLSNGKVNVTADPLSTYDFDVNVKNGLQDFFPRSASPDAVKVKISVTNGMVKKE
jgi:hypothetical protein